MPANQPYWQDLSETNGATLWSLVILADAEFVGFATVTGGVSRDVQVKKPKGADGATLTDNGYKPAEVSITLRLVTNEDWVSFQDDLLPVIHPRRKGGPRTPVVITHPATNVLGISRIYVKSIGMPELDADNVAVVAIKAIEWFPGPKPVKKAAGRNPPGQRTAPAPHDGTGIPQIPLLFDSAGGATDFTQDGLALD